MSSRNKNLLPWETYDDPVYFKPYETLFVRKFIDKNIAVEIRAINYLQKKPLRYLIAFVGLESGICKKYYNAEHQFISADHAKLVADEILEEFGYRLLQDHFKVLI